jgi:hypothetical protein
MTTNKKLITDQTKASHSLIKISKAFLQKPSSIYHKIKELHYTKQIESMKNRMKILPIPKKVPGKTIIQISGPKIKTSKIPKKQLN